MAAESVNRAVLTLEDCLPAEVWKFFSLLMRMKENGEIDPEEDLPYTTAITVTGDTIAAVHQLKEQSDEETAKEGARLVRADFEGELSMGCLKAYLDQLIEAGANKDGIKLTLQYLNADGTVLYESAFTYADLAAAVNPAA